MTATELRRMARHASRTPRRLTANIIYSITHGIIGTDAARELIEDDEFRRAMRHECCVCGRHTGGNPASGEISHGYCQACFAQTMRHIG